MPFLQGAKDVYINYSDFRDVSGDYVENVVTDGRGRRGRPNDRMTTGVGGNYYDISNYTSSSPINVNNEEIMNFIRGLSGNGRQPPTPQATSNGGNNTDSRYTSRSSRNNTDDDMYMGSSRVPPPAGERRDGSFGNFIRTNGGHNGQAGTSNVNPAGSIKYTRRVSSSRSGEQSSPVDPAGAQIDFMNDGSSGGVVISNATLAFAGRSVRASVASRHTQAPVSQFSPTGGHEDGDGDTPSAFTSRYLDPTSYTRPGTEVGGGVTRGSITSEPRASASGSQATLDDGTSPLHNTSRLSTNVPRPEVSINEALKEPPSKKEAGFLGF